MKYSLKLNVVDSNNPLNINNSNLGDMFDNLS